MILYNHMLQAHVLEPEKVSGAIFKTNHLNMARKYKKYEIAKLQWQKAANIVSCFSKNTHTHTQPTFFVLFCFVLLCIFFIETCDICVWKHTHTHTHTKKGQL